MNSRGVTSLFHSPHPALAHPWRAHPHSWAGQRGGAPPELGHPRHPNPGSGRRPSAGRAGPEGRSPGPESRPPGDGRGAAGRAGPGGVLRPTSEPGPPAPTPRPAAVGAARDGGPAPAAPVRSDAPQPAAAGARLPAYRAQLGPHVAAALRSLRRRHRCAPGPPAAASPRRRGAPSPAQWRRAGGGRPASRPRPARFRPRPEGAPGRGRRNAWAAALLATAPRPKAHPPTRCVASSRTLAVSGPRWPSKGRRWRPPTPPLLGSKIKSGKLFVASQAGRRKPLLGLTYDRAPEPPRGLLVPQTGWLPPPGLALSLEDHPHLPQDQSCLIAWASGQIFPPQ